MTPIVSLPPCLTIDGVVYLVQFQAEHYCVLQNYAGVSPPSDQPLITPGGQIIGESRYHLYEIIKIDGCESLGGKVGSYTDLQAAMNAADKQQP